MVQKTPVHEIANVTVLTSLVLANLLGIGISLLYQRTRRQLYYQAERERMMKEALESAESRVEQLSTLIPMCASCKMVRDDTGYWEQVENYVTALSGSQVSHGLCPSCAAKALAEDRA